jgi:sigma-B regulation protein RsbU (phosphoserine phosphatase)
MTKENFTTISSPEQKILDLEELLEKKSRQMQDIATMGMLLTSLFDLDQVLSVLMEMSLEMVGAEVGAIVVSEQGESKIRVSLGIDDSFLDSLCFPSRENLVQKVLNSGEKFFLEGVEAKRFFNPMNQKNVSSLIALPIKTKERIAGAVIVVNKRNQYEFTEDDLFNLELIVNFAGVAFENAELLKTSLEKQKLEQQLLIAEEVQRALLPEKGLSLPNAEFQFLYLPAYKIGGDFYDIIPQSPRKFILAIGDVSNKGIPAALMMAAVRTILRAEVQNERRIKEIIFRVNNLLCQEVVKQKDMFISLFCGFFNLEKMTLNYCNAGHLPPFLKRGNEIFALKEGGVILGQFEDFSYREKEIEIFSKDCFLFYTDGLTECTNAKNEMLGLKKLEEFFLEDDGGNNFLTKLNQKILDFTEEGFEFDDRTAVWIKIK